MLDCDIIRVTNSRNGRNTMKKKLTPKQEKQYKTFAQEYIISFNGTDSAIKAGYAVKSARVTASKLLTQDNIQELIKYYMKKRENRTEITGDMVVKELAKLAFSDVRNLYDNERLLLPHELDDQTASTISSFKTRREGDKEEGFYEMEEYKRYDKTKALEMLGRHFGIFNDKLKVEGEFNLTNFVKTLHDERS